MAEQIIVSVDGTELSNMDACPEKWRLGHVEHWRPRKKPIYLDRGSIMHAMLAHYYRQKLKMRVKNEEQFNIVQECIALGRTMIASTEIPAEQFEEEDLRVFRDYIIHWQRDGWEVRHVEAPFSKTLYDSPRLHIDYTGVIDLIVVDPKLGRIVVDHKTEGRRSAVGPLTNQFLGYEWASGNPVICNKIGYQKESTPIEQRFRRIQLSSMPEVINEWRTDTIKTVIESLGWMQDLEKGRRLKKNRTSCDKYSGCEFIGVCKEQSDVREHILFVNFMKKKWDPFTRDDEESAA